MLSVGKRLHVADIDKGRRVEILEPNNVTEGEGECITFTLCQDMLLLAIRDPMGGEKTVWYELK